MSPRDHYDGVAEWYEREFGQPEFTASPREAITRLLGDGPGTLLDVGCGTGIFTSMMARHRWAVKGIDVSTDMLRIARDRGLDVVQGDAAALPFPDSCFDAALSMWTHTDIDDFRAVLREVKRVLRKDGLFVYVGAHPCFVGPHSEFVAAEGLPRLHRGYWRTGRYIEGPGISPQGSEQRSEQSICLWGCSCRPSSTRGFGSSTSKSSSDASTRT
jgi:ubiquinone/menaquinone biosynthesis C-methylase UbiE